MQTIFIVGDEPGIPGITPSLSPRLNRTQESRQVRAIRWREISLLPLRQAAAIIFDLRQQDTAAIDTIDSLRARRPRVPFLYRFNSKQLEVEAWQRLLTDFTDFVTERSSQVEIERRLQRLLDRLQASGAGSRESIPATSHARLDSEWRRRNARRISLVYKRLNSQLTSSEEAELSLLQDEASRYINRVSPLPFDELSEFEQAAQQLLGRSND